VLPDLRCTHLLVYFDYSKNTDNWVIRDLISGQRLGNFYSTLTRQQIENDADHNEFPPWLNVEEHPDEWALYLRLRTSAVFTLRGSGVMASPHPQTDGWLPL
jgi:hypothetical protein